MNKEAITTGQAPQAIGPYSQAIQASGFLFVSGQIPLDPATGEMVSGDITEQTRRAMDNLIAIVEASGLTADHIVKTTVFLADMNDFAVVNGVYASYFEGTPPARAAIQVARLPKDARIEIEAVAIS